MATINGSTSSSEWTFKLEVTETGISVQNNTSTVVVEMFIGRANSQSYLGGNWSGSITVDGSTQSISGNIPYPTYINAGAWLSLGSKTFTVAHNNDGTKTASVSASMSSSDFNPSSASASGSVVLSTIPRYTSITSFTVSKRNETSFTFNWQTANTVDYVWYSTNNGSSWTGYDVSDGTSGSFTVSGLNPNTTYNCKIRVRRKDSQLTTDSTSVSQTTYKAPTQSFSSKTETTITMNWSCDTAANYIWYSKDNGNNWTAVGSVNATSGSYTITGLTANTSYNIKTRVRRSSTNTTYDTSASSQTTYNYPSISNPQIFTIGNVIKMTLNNPLNRSCTIYIKGNDNSVICTTTKTNNGNIEISSNSSEITAQYASIPNSKTGTYKVRLVCSAVSRDTTVNGNTYSIIGTEVPTFSNFTFQDSNSSVVAITGNNQIFVKNKSTLQVNISSANKMVANYSATPNKYDITCANRSSSVNYSSSDVSNELGTLSSYGSVICTVKAVDSRSLATSVSKNLTVVNYFKPTIIPAISRVNNFENTTNINCSGTFAPIIVDGTPKNDISTIQFRYKKVSDISYGSWESLQFATNRTNGTYTCVNKTVLLDNTETYSLQIQVIDVFETETITVIVSEGVPIMFISSTNKNVGIGVQNNNEEYSLEVAGNMYLDGYVHNALTVENIESKNLLDLSNDTDHYGSVLSNKTTATIDWMEGSTGRIEFNYINNKYDDYTLSYTANTDTNGNRYYIKCLDSSGNIITNLSLSGFVYNAAYKGYYKSFTTANVVDTFSLPSQVNKFTIGFVNVIANSVMTYSYVQLEKGKFNTGFIEYQEFVNQDVYSTSEKIIGKWINNKPLYRKTYKIQTTSSSATNGEVPIRITSLNIDEIVNIYGTTVSDTYCRALFNTYAYNNLSVTEYSGVFYEKSTNNLRFRYRGVSLSYANVTIEYTKTTD